MASTLRWPVCSAQRLPASTARPRDADIRPRRRTVALGGRVAFLALTEQRPVQQVLVALRPSCHFLGRRGAPVRSPLVPPPNLGVGTRSSSSSPKGNPESEKDSADELDPAGAPPAQLPTSSSTPAPASTPDFASATGSVSSLVAQVVLSPVWPLLLLLSLLGFFGGYGFLVASNAERSNVPILLGPRALQRGAVQQQQEQSRQQLLTVLPPMGPSDSEAAPNTGGGEASAGPLLPDEAVPL